MRNFILSINDFLVNIGIMSGNGTFLDTVIAFSIILAVAFLSDFICRKIAIIVLHFHAKLTKNTKEESEEHKKLLTSFAAIIPAIIVFILLPLAFGKDSHWMRFIGKSCVIYILVMALLFAYSLLNFIYFEYTRRHKNGVSIKGMFQIFKIALGFIAFIVSIGVIVDKSPLSLLAGIGASAAVLSLIFKDTIIGFISGIQLSSNKMLNIGDWITVPKFNADGIVKEITLNTVKIQNFDNTIVTIPPNELISDSFQNWIGMQKSGGRRIRRSINIDMTSVKFCTPEMIRKFQKIDLLKNFFIQMGFDENMENTVPFKERNLTNLTVFRTYLEAYIQNLPTYNPSLTHMIRQLQPTDAGIPVEIYFFTTEKRWEYYESIQTNLFEHIIAIIPEFDLCVFQNPTGNDFRKAMIKNS